MTAAPRTFAVLAAAICTCAFSAASPAASSAADFCVKDPACVSGGGTDKPDVPSALSAAAAIFGTDRVLIGPGDFHLASGATYDTAAALNSVEIAGAGEGVTRLIYESISPSGATLTLTGKPLSKVRDLSIVAGAGNFKSTPVGLDITGTAQRVDVQSGTDGLPVELEAGATLRDSHVSSGDPVLASVETRGTGSATIAGSTIDGGKGGAVRMTSPGTLAITTSRLTGSDGAVARDENGTLTIDSSLVRVTGTGLEAQDGHLVAENVTVVGDGQPGTIGAESFDGNPGGAATLVIENSVITGFDRSLETAHFSGTPTLTARFSNYTGKVDRSAGTLTEAQGNTHLDPGFVDAAGGDFRLRADSPVLDQGTIPAPAQQSGTDLGGDPRIADGTGKGTPLPDMGAFEFQPHPPVAAITAPDSAIVGDAVAFSSASSSDPDPGDSLKAHWSIDGVPADGADQSRTFAATGAIAVTLTVTDRAGLTATASKTLVVQPAPGGVVTPPPSVAPALTGFSITSHRFAVGRHAAFRFKLSKDARVKIVVSRSGRRLHRSGRTGSIARSGHAGRNRVRFSGRIGGRKLKPGRYVATGRAIDAAGRASSKRTVKFTILR